MGTPSGLTPLGRTAGQLVLLRRLTAALADAMTPDDVARVTMDHAVQVDHVLRAGLATLERGGRELGFVASDDDSVTSTAVRWCRIEGLADVPMAECVRTATPVLLPTADDLLRRFPHLHERQTGLGMRSMAALPLMVDERPIGALMLSFDEPRDFEVPSLDALADTLGA